MRTLMVISVLVCVTSLAGCDSYTFTGSVYSGKDTVLASATRDFTKSEAKEFDTTLSFTTKTECTLDWWPSHNAPCTYRYDKANVYVTVGGGSLYLVFHHSGDLSDDRLEASDAGPLDSGGNYFQTIKLKRTH
jgi:hypothetical protein